LVFLGVELAAVAGAAGKEAKEKRQISRIVRIDRGFAKGRMALPNGLEWR
jgi:hypothetical protein